MRSLKHKSGPPKTTEVRVTREKGPVSSQPSSLGPIPWADGAECENSREHPEAGPALVNLDIRPYIIYTYI